VVKKLVELFKSALQLFSGSCGGTEYLSEYSNGSELSGLSV
jgi:hypothetical protein